MKLILKVLLFIVLCFGTAQVFGMNDQQLRQRFEQEILTPPSDAGIDQNVWQNAVISQLSQCANVDNEENSEDCKCALVVAQGVRDIYTTRMWIGTFAGGTTTPLWQGFASRKASADQNRTSVNMRTNRCKRRNGVATVSGNQACIPGRRCRDASIYRNLVAELGLPPTVALTSFYFSTPMHNETYKFHDFYPCTESRCPATLGCLGLERFAMKDLCLRHMGSNGSNGIDAPERGGAWLYFHNINSPGVEGDRDTAFRAYKKMAQGTLCANTSTARLGDGSPWTPSGGHSLTESGFGGDQYDGSSGSASGSAMQAMQAFGNSGYQPPAPPEGAETPEQQEAQAAYTKQIIDACEETVSDACPQVESNVIRDYCADQRSYERGSCEFRKISGDGE
ncbi:MAG: hypothetical protein NXH75_04455 [Halobacteriovoraceae bacterium]|nr:hypothetical protein [Halobacteriovoraceae bacterium]